MAHASYRFGPFLVDGVAYRLWRGRDALDLTPQLLDLLVYLLEHAGTLVPKDTLLTALWPDANVTDHALFQAVSSCAEPSAMTSHSPRYQDDRPPRLSFHCRRHA
jgi:DNA-binding winged helix-turn-helix (wHTH) protein